MQATVKLFSQPLLCHSEATLCLKNHALHTRRPGRLLIASRHSEANGNRENRVHPNHCRDSEPATKDLRRVTMPAQRRAASSIIALAAPMDPSQRQLRTPTPLHETAELHSHKPNSRLTCHGGLNTGDYVPGA
jgi:hypothetical protein